MEFRKVKPEDTGPLTTYFQQLSQETKSYFAPHPIDTDVLSSICRENYLGYRAFVCLKDGLIIAYVVVKTHLSQGALSRFSKYPIQLDPESDAIIAPSVADAVQSQGIGSVLLSFVEGELKKSGTKKIILWGGVQLRNQRAVRYYLKNGFRTLGEFRHDGLDNLDMVKYLGDVLWNQKMNWVKDLVIYEVNPYAFTSPNGAGIDGGGSGTFKSMNEKIPYLSDIGINGIWLAGFSHATSHFRGIPSVYATTDPSVLDPRLGTTEDFKQLIATAHKYGIKIFLDVITHGVTNDSPLLTEHPDWFEGTSWGMTDFKYDHPGFRKWWVATWTNYVIEYNIDGFRLDGPNGYDSDEKTLAIWDEIITFCGLHGKEILVFPENMRLHFQQGLDGEPPILPTETHKPIKNRLLSRPISNHDFGIDKKADRSYYALKGSRFKLAYCYIFSTAIPILMSGEEFNAEYRPLPAAQKDMFGGGGPSAWLYASWLNWKLSDSQKEFLEDFKTIMNIKKRFNHILNYDQLGPSMKPVHFESSTEGLPIPYVRYIKNECILVVGNDKNHEVHIELELPVDQIFDKTVDNFEIVDLWRNNSFPVSREELRKLRITVKKDFQKNGGVGIFYIRNEKEMK